MFRVLCTSLHFFGYRPSLHDCASRVPQSKALVSPLFPARGYLAPRRLSISYRPRNEAVLIRLASRRIYPARHPPHPPSDTPAVLALAATSSGTRDRGVPVLAIEGHRDIVRGAWRRSHRSLDGVSPSSHFSAFVSGVGARVIGSISLYSSLPASNGWTDLICVHILRVSSRKGTRLTPP